MSHWSGINKINNKFCISPIVLVENLEVIGIKTQNNSNIAIFSRYLFEKFEKFLKGKLNINNNEIINDKKTEEKNLKKFSKFICKITNFGNIEENGFFKNK